MAKHILKIPEKLCATPDQRRINLVPQAKCRQQSSSLPHAPFNRVNTEGSVGDVGRAQVLATGQEVFEPYWNQRSKGDLKWPGAKIEIASTVGPRMKVNPIAADPY